MSTRRPRLVGVAVVLLLVLLAASSASAMQVRASSASVLSALRVGEGDASSEGEDVACDSKVLFYLSREGSELWRTKTECKALIKTRLPGTCTRECDAAARALNDLIARNKHVAVCAQQDVAITQLLDLLVDSVCGQGGHNALPSNKNDSRKGVPMLKGREDLSGYRDPNKLGVAFDSEGRPVSFSGLPDNRPGVSTAHKKDAGKVVASMQAEAPSDESGSNVSAVANTTHKPDPCKSQPCKSPLKCVPDPKQCVQAPCLQYKCVVNETALRRHARSKVNHTHIARETCEGDASPLARLRGECAGFLAQPSVASRCPIPCHLALKFFKKAVDGSPLLLECLERTAYRSLLTKFAGTSCDPERLGLTGSRSFHLAGITATDPLMAEDNPIEYGGDEWYLEDEPSESAESESESGSTSGASSTDEEAAGGASEEPSVEYGGSEYSASADYGGDELDEYGAEVEYGGSSDEYGGDGVDEDGINRQSQQEGGSEEDDMATLEGDDEPDEESASGSNATTASNSTSVVEASGSSSVVEASGSSSVVEASASGSNSTNTTQASGNDEDEDGAEEEDVEDSGIAVGGSSSEELLGASPGLTSDNLEGVAASEDAQYDASVGVDDEGYCIGDPSALRLDADGKPVYCKPRPEGMKFDSTGVPTILGSQAEASASGASGADDEREADHEEGEESEEESDASGADDLGSLDTSTLEYMDWTSTSSGDSDDVDEAEREDLEAEAEENNSTVSSNSTASAGGTDSVVNATSSATSEYQGGESVSGEGEYQGGESAPSEGEYQGGSPSASEGNSTEASLSSNSTTSGGESAESGGSSHVEGVHIPDSEYELFKRHFEDKLIALHEAGYTDERRNLELLVEYYGNMNKVLAVLDGVQGSDDIPDDIFGAEQDSLPTSEEESSGESEEEHEASPEHSGVGQSNEEESSGVPEPESGSVELPTENTSEGQPAPTLPPGTKVVDILERAFE